MSGSIIPPASAATPGTAGSVQPSSGTATPGTAGSAVDPVNPAAVSAAGAITPSDAAQAPAPMTLQAALAAAESTLLGVTAKATEAASSAAAAAVSASAAASDAAEVGATVPGELAARVTSVENVTKGVVSVSNFGAVGDGVTDDTAALNAAAKHCRDNGFNTIVVPPTSAHYLVSATVDFTKIKVVKAEGALIKTSGTGFSVVKIGDGVRGAEINLEVRHNSNSNSAAGTYGVEVLGMSDSKLRLYARSFLSGVYFNGVSQASFVGNSIEVNDLYNNLRHIHIHLDSGSYFIANQFRGGGCYYGVGAANVVPGVAAGLFYLQLSGSSRVQDVVYYDAEIGVDAPSTDEAEYGYLVYADMATNVTDNAIKFVNARLEIYGSTPTTPLGMHVKTSTNGSKVFVEADFTNCYPRLAMRAPDTARSAMVASVKQNRQSGGVFDPSVYPKPSTLEFTTTTSNRIYLPNRMLLDFGVAYQPQRYLVSGVHSGQSAAVNGRDLMVHSSNVSFGRKFIKPVGTALHAKVLGGKKLFAIVCFDANGNILGGDSPQYAGGENCLQTNRGIGDFYRINGNSFFVHPDVAGFYIGGTPWSSSGLVDDVEFDVTFGPQLREDFTDYTDFSLVLDSAPKGTFLPKGVERVGESGKGWKNAFNAKRAIASAASLGSATVVLDSVTGIQVGDAVGIQTTGAHSLYSVDKYKYHITTVASIDGNELTLTTPLAHGGVVAGAAVLLNRWEVIT